MDVFVFDFLAYKTHLDHLKVDGELPHPLEKRHFDPAAAMESYAEHLDAWEELDKLGFDGVGFNEHHTSPYGLMNSPNLLAAAAAQRTKRLKLLIYGNLLPIHQPIRLAEELAMLDCMSRGRVISGFARGIPREYKVYNVPLAESRARFEEAYDIVVKAWTAESFSHEGRFWQYKDVSIWPRPVQQPHPPVWVPVTTSQESIEWAASHNIPITPGIAPQLRNDIIRYYAKCLARHGHRITPDHLKGGGVCYIADSKAQAVKEFGPYHLYFHRTLFSHGNVSEAAVTRQQGYIGEHSGDYITPENRRAAEQARSDFRNITMDDVARMAETMPMGTADEVRDRLIRAADAAGTNTIVVHMNHGAMPHEMFLEQIRRFAKDVLPALKKHQVTHVPLAEQVAAE